MDLIETVVFAVIVAAAVTFVGVIDDMSEIVVIGVVLVVVVVVVIVVDMLQILWVAGNIVVDVVGLGVALSSPSPLSSSLLLSAQAFHQH